MASAVKVCRTCGKEYTPCNGSRLNNAGVFRWQEVACSPECAAKYFAAIAASREEDVNARVEQSVNEEFVEDDFAYIDEDDEIEIET